MRLTEDSHPGFQRFALGTMRLTVLFDGVMDAHPAALSGVPQDEIIALMRFEGADAPPTRISVNAWVIETAPGTDGNQTILVDGGALPGMAERAGHTMTRLEEAGVALADIDILFCTHLHPDHIGMFVRDGEATLPRAILMLHEAEMPHWLDDARMAAAPDRAKPFFIGARRVIDAYSGRTESLADGGEIAPGIALAHLPGHTPGHCGLRIESDGDALLIMADIVHIDSVQFPRPEAAIMFDVDKVAAAETRHRVFREAAASGVPIAGAHVTFPGIGNVFEEGQGFRFEPLG